MSARKPLSPGNLFAGTALDPNYVPPRHPLCDIYEGMGRAAANGQRVLIDDKLYNDVPSLGAARKGPQL